MSETTAQKPRSARLPVKLLAYRHEAVLVAFLIGLTLYAQATDPDFLAPNTQRELLRNIGELALLAVPMTLILLTGGIDLSVGSTMALSAVVLGMSFEAGLPPSLGALLAVLTGLGAGMLNGVFIAYVRVHPLIVTLATLAAYRGIAEGISLARPISGFPESFTRLAGTFGGLPIPIWIVLVLGLLGAFALWRTPFGLSLYAIGHNETATRYSGIDVDRIKLWVYGLSGFAAGLAAVLYVARRNTAKADIGLYLELDVITAVVLGGASIFGGRGNLFGTLLGVLLIHETREFVSWRWARDELNLIVLGGLLIVSALLNRFLLSKEER